MDHSDKLRTLRARSIWNRLSNMPPGETVDISALARLENCTERTIYRALREIKDVGLLTDTDVKIVEITDKRSQSFHGIDTGVSSPPTGDIERRARARGHDNSLIDEYVALERKSTSTTGSEKETQTEDWRERVLAHLESNTALNIAGLWGTAAEGGEWEVVETTETVDTIETRKKRRL